MELYDFQETIRKTIKQQASAYGWWLSKPYQTECWLRIEPLQGDVACEFVAETEHPQVEEILRQLRRCAEKGPVAGKPLCRITWLWSVTNI